MKWKQENASKENILNENIKKIRITGKHQKTKEAHYIIYFPCY